MYHRVSDLFFFALLLSNRTYLLLHDTLYLEDLLLAHLEPKPLNVLEYYDLPLEYVLRRSYRYLI